MQISRIRVVVIAGVLASGLLWGCGGSSAEDTTQPIVSDTNGDENSVDESEPGPAEGETAEGETAEGNDAPGIGLENVGHASEGAREGDTSTVLAGRMTTEGMGSLERSVIQRVIRSRLRPIRFCFDREAIEDPTLNGRVNYRFTISAAGSVQSVQVLETTLNNETVEQCVAQQLARLTFPEPEGNGPVLVTYPFVFIVRQ